MNRHRVIIISFCLLAATVIYASTNSYWPTATNCTTYLLGDMLNGTWPCNW